MPPRVALSFLVVGVAIAVGGWALRSPDEIGGKDRREVELPPPVDLSMADRDLDLFGAITDSDAVAIAGAEITTIRYPGRRTVLRNPEVEDEPEFGPTTLSARDGTFSVRLPRGRLVDLRVSHPGYAETTVALCQAGERVEVSLERPATLAVHVLDPSGAPASGALVTVWGQDPQPRGARSYPKRTARTESNGVAKFDRLQSGPGVIEVAHERFGSPSGTRFTLGPGETSSVEVRLREGRTIRGSVTDAATGAPIEGAIVGADEEFGRPVRTDAEGRFIYYGWTGGRVTDLHAKAEGYSRFALEVPSVAGRLDFALVPGHEVVGRLVAAGGEPVSEALVSAYGRRGVGDGREIDSAIGRSESDGRFRLTSLRTDLPHTLVVLADGFGRTLLDFAPSMSVEGRIDLGDIELPRGRVIEGQVVWETGDPVPYESVLLEGSNPDRGRLGVNSRLLAAPYGRSEVRVTDDLGRFRFPDLAPGSYEVGILLQGWPRRFESVEIDPDEPTLPPIIFTVERGREFSARLVSADGNPIPGGRMTLVFGEERLVAVTDEFGAAYFGGLPDGEARLGGSAVGFMRGSRMTISATQASATLALTPSAVLRGVVRGPDGLPLSRPQVRVCWEEEERTTIAGPDGTFSFEVPEGQTVVVSLTGLRGTSRRVTVRSGYAAEPMEVTDTNAPIEIRATSGSPTPPPG